MAKLLSIPFYNLVLLAGATIALKEGDPCSINHQSGICRLRSACQEYPRLKELGIRPRICGYQATEPVICCPSSGESESSSRTSERYCHEYRKLVSTEITYSGLAIGEKPQRDLVPKCDETVELIVGGQETKPGEFPHMAVLGALDEDGNVQFSCGGSLISDRYVLTAGHCVRNTRGAPTLVRLGDHDLHSTADKLNHVTLDIGRIVVHPDYKPSKASYHDIALIELAEAVTFRSNIRPACLWSSERFNGSNVIAIGYGATEAYGPTSDRLMKVRLEVLPNDRCSGFYTGHRKLPSAIMASQMCAHSPEGDKDTCQGDSGGPLQVTTEGHKCLYHIVGVTSFGISCGQQESAGVYTNVATYLDWIESVVWPEY